MLLVCLAFLLMGMPFVRRLGIEADEALIGNGIYERGAPWYSWNIFGAEIPVMILTYLGALKTWIYDGLFLIWEPGAVSLRLPMMLVGAVTIWVFYLLLARIAGARAAVIGAILLATDPSFLLTESVDLGFVVFQHLFKIGAVLLLLRYHQGGSRRDLALGFFLLGLGLWDKALFLWVLGGLGVATLVAFPRQLWSHLRPKPLVIAVTAFCIGALPFIVYNIARPLETFRSNAAFSLRDLDIKIHLLRESLNGRGLWGFLVAAEPGPVPGKVHSIAQKFAVWLSQAAGTPHRTVMELGLLFALLLLPFLWRTPARKPMLFALVCLLVIWVQMAITLGAGGAVHHIILLWPFQIVFVAIAIHQLGARLRRIGGWITVVLAMVLCGSNLLVDNQYFLDLIHNGGALRWTDAIDPLTNSLGRTRAKHILVADWGILETLNLLSAGSLPVVPVHHLLGPNPAPADRSQLLAVISDPAEVFVCHSAGNEVWPENSQRLTAFANGAGYQKELLETVYDRNGRAIFEVFRFRHA